MPSGVFGGKNSRLSGSEAAGVLGVEVHHPAVLDAGRAAQAAGLPEVRFRAGRAERICRRLFLGGSRFRLAAANPPRTGLHPDLPVTLADDGRDHDAVAAARMEVTADAA